MKQLQAFEILADGVSLRRAGVVAGAIVVVARRARLAELDAETLALGPASVGRSNFAVGVLSKEHVVIVTVVLLPASAGCRDHICRLTLSRSRSRFSGPLLWMCRT